MGRKGVLVDEEIVGRKPCRARLSDDVDDAPVPFDIDGRDRHGRDPVGAFRAIAPYRLAGLHARDGAHGDIPVRFVADGP